MSIDPYKDLPLLKNQRLKFSSASPFVPTYVKSNLTQTSNPDEIYATRVHGRKILLENPVKQSKLKTERLAKKERSRKEKEKRKLAVIGRKEAKERRIWKLEDSQAKFHLFVPLHHLWMGYMSELLALPQPSPSQHMPSASLMHPKLLKADFHGSYITVRQSKNIAVIGLAGIVVHESENAFKIVTRKDQMKLIPKQNSIFAFAVPLYSTLPKSHGAEDPLPVPAPDSTSTVLDKPHIEFELYGNQFRFRTADRASRKFKHKETIEL
ncbi:RNase P/MRP, p29 subunit [Mycena floridula]|nr:RNase P/MRP, p29 subunit [Mycena floridula]